MDGGCSSRTGTNYGGVGGIDGGAGGNALTKRNNSTTYTSGGGAGNPGGKGSLNNSLTSSYRGQTGTGGLLIIYANNMKNEGTIKSNGSSGGGVRSGGGSGGGSINIFYKNTYECIKGIYSNAGGPKTGSTQGGAGGNGTTTIGSIATGTFTK